MEPNSFRPIALTPFLAKLFERCIHPQLINHMDRFEIFSRNQYGFRSGLSTESALLEVNNMIRTSVSGGNVVAAILCDISKAFDCLDHLILLSILSHYGASFDVVSWFSSYLSERSIRVASRGVVSDSFTVSHGVGQGTVLGPSLFLLYVNHILLLSCSGGSSRIIAFADDTSVLFPLQKGRLNFKIADCNTTLNDLFEAFTSLRLALNPTKTKLMFFRSSLSKLHLPINAFCINGVPLTSVDSSTLLGVTFQANLSWLGHIDKVCKRSACAISILHRLRQFGTDLKTLILVYKTLFLPIATYCLLVWGGGPNYILKRMQVLQNDALRAVLGVDRSHSGSQIRQRLRLLSMKKLFYLRLYLLGHGLYYSSHQCPWTSASPSFLSPLLPLERSSPIRQLRSHSLPNLPIPKYLSQMARQCSAYLAPIHWNSLPTHIRLTKSRPKFKQMCISYLLEK